MTTEIEKDEDILDKLAILDDESKDLLRYVEEVNISFNNCYEAVDGLLTASVRIEKTFLLL
ncbi:hypothetical protein CWI38_0323p0040 [Hamiltosporidium tvaerminnensis]|uniref:Uncharacterized protein n=1 Tax=Hamiltosporidium tvaerminnensis TaxID=1176355 RepID=A0A4Q9M0T9_9MICR|nr:hypothetical protein CWI38_0323p0040 [Hamiltosporidium tvaerminnensis]